MFAQITALALLAAKATATIYYAGVAESSGEFGVWSPNSTPGTGLPGRFGVEYAFINESAIDVYVDVHKANTFRVAFLLERMCPLSYGLGAKFNETHFDYYKQAIDYITLKKGAYAIFDPHNYMRYGDPSSQPFSGPVIGDVANNASATTAQFGAFWGELARRFKDNEKVIFGLMNEPHDMTTKLVVENNQAAITAIRAAGANQLIIAPGNSWTGGHAWTEGSDPSSALMQTLVDPVKNTAIDIHEYLDVDYSGGHADCKSLGSEKLAPLTAWLKQYGYKAMITEFGSANNTQCHEYMTDILNYMSNNEEYIGWTAWAAGPFWGSASPCCTDQLKWGSLEPYSLASDGSPGLYYTVWLQYIQPLLPKTLQWTGISSIKAPSKTNTGVKHPGHNPRV